MSARLPLAVGVLAALLITGCDGGITRAEAPPLAQPPAWFTQPPQQAGFLHAVGSAPLSQREQAIARARQDLVAQLRLSIAATSTRQENYSSSDATGQSRAERLAQEARSDVQTRSAIDDLPGITVVEQLDRGDSSYALLRFDRSAWADDLLARIADIDARSPAVAATVLAMPTETATQRVIAAGAHIRRVVPLLVQRDELLSRLRLAKPGSPMPKDTIDRTAIDGHLAQLLADLPVALPTDPSVRSLLPQITESLRSIGLRAVPGDQPAALILPLRMSKRSEIIDGQVKIDGTITGSLGIAPDAEGKGSRDLGGIRLSERASSLTEDVATFRLHQKLAAKLAADLDQRLTRMLAGE